MVCFSGCHSDGIAICQLCNAFLIMIENGEPFGPCLANISDKPLLGHSLHQSLDRREWPLPET